MSRPRGLLLLSLSLALAACGRGGSSSPGEDGAPPGAPDAAYPAPQDDLVARVGSDGALDVATWNIENFPKAQSTPRVMADLITSLDLDLIAVQEIEDVEAFEELTERLPRHAGVLSDHYYGDGSYQKVGFLYRADLLTVEGAILLFEQDGYNFPRPPLQVTVSTEDAAGEPVEFVAITLHLKAGFDGEDRARRDAAIETLEDHVAQTVSGASGTEVLLLGDFNDIVTTAGGQEVFEPFLGSPELYTVHTSGLAASGAASFVPSDSLIDHAISTADLSAELEAGEELIPSLDQQLTGYVSEVSDHLPVVVTMPIY